MRGALSLPQMYQAQSLPLSSFNERHPNASESRFAEQVTGHSTHQQVGELNRFIAEGVAEIDVFMNAGQWRRAWLPFPVEITPRYASQLFDRFGEVLLAKITR